MKKLYVESKINNLTILFANSIYGDQAFWPQILLGNAEFELSLLAYRLLHEKLPESESELETHEVKEGYQRLIEGLRCRLQTMFNSLVETKTLENSMETDVTQYNKFVKLNLEKTKAAKTFLKNNSVDYGNETVAQIAARLNISKAEVRRRKQEGTLETN